ncbi:SIP domain-containing protein [Microbacterium sp. RD1]|uniref:SIP domain-containing protein n=1 Tax=Microbacterium sp. RD1 TaxID=3457313 RepID=UPI003FA5A453
MTPMPEHNPTACRAPRHTRVQHLVTADESSLAELEAVLATLPLCSTGRVFVEVPDESWVGALSAPPRMTVTWLDRSRRSGAPGTGRGCAAGEAVARAVAGWAGEMLDAHEPDATRVILLGGYLGTADIVDELVERRGMSRDAIHTPERFHIPTR